MQASDYQPHVLRGEDELRATLRSCVDLDRCGADGLRPRLAGAGRGGGAVPGTSLQDVHDVLVRVVRVGVDEGFQAQADVPKVGALRCLERHRGPRASGDDRAGGVGQRQLAVGQRIRLGGLRVAVMLLESICGYSSVIPVRGGRSGRTPSGWGAQS